MTEIKTKRDGTTVVELRTEVGKTLEVTLRNRLIQLTARYIGMALLALAVWLTGDESYNNESISLLSVELAAALVGVAGLFLDVAMHRRKMRYQDAVIETLADEVRSSRPPLPRDDGMQSAQ